MNRIGRFVRAAQQLLLVQAIAAVIAAALGIWAVIAVRDLAFERDRLRDRVTELETRQPLAPAATPTAPQGPAPSPLDNEVRPPAILPIPIPVTETPLDVNQAQPADPAADPGAVPDQPGTTTTPEQDCSGTNATLPRCQRGRWRPVPGRELPPVRTVPQPQAPNQPN